MIAIGADVSSGTAAKWAEAAGIRGATPAPKEVTEQLGDDVWIGTTDGGPVYFAERDHAVPQPATAPRVRQESVRGAS